MGITEHFKLENKEPDQITDLSVLNENYLDINQEQDKIQRNLILSVAKENQYDNNLDKQVAIEAISENEEIYISKWLLSKVIKYFVISSVILAAIYFICEYTQPELECNYETMKMAEKVINKEYNNAIKLHDPHLTSKSKSSSRCVAYTNLPKQPAVEYLMSYTKSKKIWMGITIPTGYIEDDGFHWAKGTERIAPSIDVIFDQLNEDALYEVDSIDKEAYYNVDIWTGATKK